MNNDIAMDIMDTLREIRNEKQVQNEILREIRDALKELYQVV